MTGNRIRLRMFAALLVAGALQAQTHAAARPAVAGTRAEVRSAAVRPPAASTQPEAPAHEAQVRKDGADLRLAGGTLSLRLLGDNTLCVHFVPDAGSTPPTLVMAPHPAGPGPETAVIADRRGGDLTLHHRQLRVVFDRGSDTLTVFTAGARHPLLRLLHLHGLARGRVALQFNATAPLYGVHGTDAFDQKPAQLLLRRGRVLATAGAQGDAGAPLVWSTAGFGVLVDSRGATFDVAKGRLRISRLSRPDPDFYLIAGDPESIFAAVADLSGHPPLFPKWSLGFINSQWGIDQKELLQDIKTYRAKHIPLDAFELDFDWKAWGQDGYGEFRWNPRQFPDGPSGKLERQLDAAGVHLVGIMKPRIHVDTEEGRYATTHRLWIPGEKASPDYFSHKPVKDLDFDNPATREWFFNPALAHSFATGIVGWWNDEADEAGGDTQFLNMERALYEGQRAHSDTRVFSLNRNFWLGAQRYAYGLWSGDIQTGFATMARQRSRMLSAIDVGEMWWSMDGGGFHGHPSDENYARWMEFGAFTPIFRVHGTFGEKRQPWHYGPIAERAATRAMRLRYRLLPYMYSYAWHDHVDGVGLVRPLTFGWPDDPKVRSDSSAWLFGQYLLVSPVVAQGQTTKQIYLPAGTWTDWSNGGVYLGGRTITLPTDSTGWGDIPLFIRQGAIIPNQAVENYVGERPVTGIRVEVFPDSKPTDFDYYDDDGKTYAYEHGGYFLQHLSAQATAGAVSLTLGAPGGSYRPALSHYVFAVHRTVATRVTRDDAPLARVADLPALHRCAGACWTIGGDRYGGVTYIKLPAGVPARLRLQ
ncbi:MAG TPA: TIM-barrel domain-containing protein [Steroidobacteraceae bacterium]|nr:TIM-barrel domain-containing protein [Steroidobacteraceae bacterium]